VTIRPGPIVTFTI